MIATGVWQPKPVISNAAAIAAEVSCPLPIAQILASRGITAAGAKAFLNPSLDTYLESPETDPARLSGIGAAVERIFRALRNSEPILIYGDYDVDGTTATVLLKTALERIALAIDSQRPAIVRYHVPHRIREGYGMRSTVLVDAAATGTRLVISVDTGIRAVTEANEARLLGMDLIVTDHHLPDATSELPNCIAVINPSQSGCRYPFKTLCGAAVVFKLTQALLAAAAFYTDDPQEFRQRTQTKLILSLLKMVAIATIADAVPLIGENRTIVALGLAALSNPVQPGLRHLMHLARLPLNTAPTAAEVAFRIAPRINAAGRMDVASDVVELFLTRDLARARQLAEKLDRLNQERRDSEAEAMSRIEADLKVLLETHGSYPADCIVVDHPDWHRGVLGILASRVVDRTGRPALVITHADGLAHGSGRSIAGFHLLDAIAAIDSEDPSEPLFERFGGHAHAVGFSLAQSRLPLLRERLSRRAPNTLTPAMLLPEVKYDAEISFSDLDDELFQWITRLAPFGLGNPEPVFLTRRATVAAPVRWIRAVHVCLELVQEGTCPISALGWSRNSLDWPTICKSLAPGACVDILYRVRRNMGSYARSALDGLELEICALRAASES